MATFTYYKITTMKDGKKTARMQTETITRTLAEVGDEMWHFNIPNVKELVKKWDAIGKSYGTYRYFLVSLNINFEGRTV
jgi:hypothetical protein